MTDITKLSTEDLIKFSYKDLLAHQAKVNKAVELRKETEKQEVYESLLALASEKGFSFEEFAGLKPGKSKKSVSKATYRNPDNHEQIYKGGGRKPNWLVEKLANGAKIEDFVV